MSPLIPTDDYRKWILSIKDRVQASQIKAAVAVNRELLEFYWFLGEQIVEKQKSSQWGDGFLKQMSQDLSSEFPCMKGFSRRNLIDMRKWVTFWSSHPSIVQQPVAKFDADGKQLVSPFPWGHQRTMNWEATCS